jgi:nucleoside-diphosphate-sugar epimerase
MNIVAQEKIALLGFGDIARRLAPYLSDDDVQGVKRTAIVDATVPITTADCRDVESMNRVMGEGFDVIVMTFVPTAMSDQGYKEGYVDTVATVLQALDKQAQRPRLLVFVSSTSVYGQVGASWVDEMSPAEPTSYSGRRLLEAEQLLAESGHTYCCVRFSGIYGPGRRRLIDQVIAKQGSAEKPVLYTNRIHADDCAGVLAHLIRQQKTDAIDPLYIATDCEPAPIYEVKHWVANALGFDNQHLQVNHTHSTRMPRGSKRCTNKKLLMTGYQFHYPTFREGYGALLDDD